MWPERPSSFRAWLYRIGRNLALNARRGGRLRRGQPFLEEPDPDPTEAPPVAPGRPIAPSPTPGIDP